MLRREAVLPDWPALERPEESAVGALLTGGRIGVVVCGEPGIGKSHLVRAARASLSRAGRHRWLEVTGAPSRSAVPLAAADELLGAELTAEPRSLDRIAREATARLRIMADGAPIVVVAEDLQHLDEATVEVLAALCRAGAVQLLATMRGPGPGTLPVMRLLHEDLLVRIDLPPLSSEQLRDLVEAALGATVDGDVVSRVQRTTGGNPMFVREVLRSAMADRSLHLRNGVWTWRAVAQPGVQPGVRPGVRLRDLVAATIDGVDPARREILELVALAEPIGLATVLAEADPGLVHELLDSGLLALDGSSLRLRQPLYAEVLRVTTSAARRHELYQRIHPHLAGVGRPGLVGLLRRVSWGRECGLEPDPADLVRAAGAARALAQHDYALSAATAAVDQLRREAGSGSELLAAALVIRAWELRFRDRPDEALRDLTAARAALDAAEIGADAGACHLHEMGMLRADIEQYAHDRPDQALRTSSETHRHLVEELGLAGYAEAGRLDLAVRRAWAGDFTGVRDQVGSLATAADGGSPPRLAVVAPAMLALAFDGLPQQVTAMAQVHRGPAQEAVEDAPWADAELSAAHVFARIYTGDRRLLDDAEGIWSEDEPADLGLRRDPALVRAGEGRLQVARGDWRGAATALRASRELFGLRDPSGFASWVLALEAFVAVMLGERRRSAELVADADRLAGRASRALFPDTEAHLIRAGWGTGERWAAARARRLLDRVAGQGFMLAELEALHLVAVTDPDHGRSLAADSRAAELAAALDLPLGHGLAQHVDAVMRDDQELARAALRQLGECGRWLPSEVGPPGVLSPREHEIALLVAGGLSTPVIADRLALSTRTVESHLGRIYAKLQINRRTQVATALRGHPGTPRS